MPPHLYLLDIERLPKVLLLQRRGYGSRQALYTMLLKFYRSQFNAGVETGFSSLLGIPVGDTIKSLLECMWI